MIVLALVVVYTLILGWFVIGLRRGLRAPDVEPSLFVEKVSVVVCARNEEKNINTCIQSLVELDYPIDRLEIIIVDDHSEDSTGTLLQQWKKAYEHVDVISLCDASNEGGKVNALIKGIGAASGKFVFITDADCTVPKHWIKSYLDWYDDDTGMVSSITILNKDSIVSNAMSLESIQLLGMSMAGINMGIPVSIIGNNVSIRKAAYEDIGGYEHIPFSVTEDVALFQAMWHSKWGVKFKTNRDMLVTTNPPGTVAMWWRQKQRWVIGAKGLGPIGWFILIVGYIGMGASIAGFFILPLPLAILALLIKWIGDLLIILPVTAAFRRMKLLLFLPFYQFYLLFFLLCVPLQYFQKTVVWKGRDYRTKLFGSSFLPWFVKNGTSRVK